VPGLLVVLQDFPGRQSLLGSLEVCLPTWKGDRFALGLLGWAEDRNSSGDRAVRDQSHEECPAHLQSLGG
jgi:hypothetical protein